MTAKLNQVLAVEKGVKSQNYAKIGEIDKLLQKPDLYNGFHKEYRPINEEDRETLPAESKRVQRTVRDDLREVVKLSTEWWNVTAKKDWTNCSAKADIVLENDGHAHPITLDVPVTYLLFLEKQLADLHTMVKRLPVLDESENWSRDENSGLFKSGVVTTHRTKKVPKVLTMTPTTEHHPGTAQVYMDDILAGHWSTTRHSGAMRKPDKDELLERIDRLSRAVKQAREAANGTEITAEPRIGERLFDYLMEGIV